jgi:hypothetical protein
MQGPELAVGVPPAVGQVAELGQLLDVNIAHHGGILNEKTPPRRGEGHEIKNPAEAGERIKKPRRGGVFSDHSPERLTKITS